MPAILLRIFLWLTLFAAVAAIPAWLYFDSLSFDVRMWMGRPAHPFADALAPPAPDYADAANWAALPTRKDNADFVPEGESDGQVPAVVDVFYVHGTTYRGNGDWNQPPADAEARAGIDVGLRRNASVFNGCCKVYAPRYRQASIPALVDRSGSGAKAAETAYSDVERAFGYFIEHFSQGRPFIVAAQSQGSRHLRRLLVQRISKTPLLRQMVAAYPTGFWIDEAEFAAAAPDIPICAAATQTGCMAAWNPVDPEARNYVGFYDVRLARPKGVVCVNPLTWRKDGASAGHDLNPGSLALAGDRLLPRIADATCRDGELLVSKILSHEYDAVPAVLGLRNKYHSLAYALFYSSIRRNAQDRVDAYLSTNGASVAATFTAGNPPRTPAPMAGSGGANGSGCTPETGPLSDGAWFGFVTAWDASGVDLDPACFYVGEAAAAQAAARNDEHPPNNFYIVNNSKATRRVAVAPGALGFRFVDLPDRIALERTTYDGLIANPGRYQPCPNQWCAVWLFVNQGRASEVMLQYIP